MCLISLLKSLFNPEGYYLYLYSQLFKQKKLIMEEHLLKILETNSRVIIPEFGAFIVKQKSPLTLVFNEFLQYNDGLLVDFISREEGIEREVAKKKIDDFVKKVRSELNKDNKVTLGKLGVLVKNQTGKISLEAEGFVPKESTASTGKSEAAAPPKKEEVKSTEADDIDLDVTDDSPKESEPEKEKPKPVQEKKKEPVKKTEKPLPETKSEKPKTEPEKEPVGEQVKQETKK